ncbi:hypothetical protein [Sphingomonas hengshuiensis]|uniref:Uncharacterized protein n=1 Tax=Sphingomonas hengshuiensis TaxID=1609977 RepID=A0A7U5BE10_9SPHN|nr:hypothetical protein [Sphingomonas hengshuiensis]AJP70582.1 hypothetical protein TS85_00150 [Sphingomonas hengshuiensis]
MSYVAKSGTLTLNSDSGIVSITKLPWWGSSGQDIFYVDFVVVSGGYLTSTYAELSRESP